MTHVDSHSADTERLASEAPAAPLNLFYLVIALSTAPLLWSALEGWRSGRHAVGIMFFSIVIVLSLLQWVRPTAAGWLLLVSVYVPHSFYIFMYVPSLLLSALAGTMDRWGLYLMGLSMVTAVCLTLVFERCPQEIVRLFLPGQSEQSTETHDETGDIKRESGES